MAKSKLIGSSFMVIVFLFALVGCMGPSHRVTGSDSKPLYLRNNIHVQEHEKKDEYRASYANWTNPGKGHVIVPVNTQVGIDYFSRGFAIIIKGTGKPIWFEYDERSTQMSADRYIDLITSSAPVSLNGFSEIDRRGISEGKVYTGMSKDGVRIALGYPAPHKTPSLSIDTWIYWTNRFKTIAVDFDDQGKVIRVK